MCSDADAIKSLYQKKNMTYNHSFLYIAKKELKVWTNAALL